MDDAAFFRRKRTDPHATARLLRLLRELNGHFLKHLIATIEIAFDIDMDALNDIVRIGGLHHSVHKILERRERLPFASDQYRRVLGLHIDVRAFALGDLHFNRRLDTHLLDDRLKQHRRFRDLLFRCRLHHLGRTWCPLWTWLTLWARLTLLAWLRLGRRVAAWPALLLPFPAIRAIAAFRPIRTLLPGLVLLLLGLLLLARLAALLRIRLALLSLLPAFRARPTTLLLVATSVRTLLLLRLIGALLSWRTGLARGTIVLTRFARLFRTLLLARFAIATAIIAGMLRTSAS